MFWGGREGYETLLNTDMGQELDHLGLFLNMAVDYKKKIGIQGQFYIEPKPKEPTKHQYDFDSGSCYAFLQKYGLVDHFKLNIVGQPCHLAVPPRSHHELEFAAANGLLGSWDANRGDLFLGWDTDQFPWTSTTPPWAMYTLLRAGGFTTGGLTRRQGPRQSVDGTDLFHAHIGGMTPSARFEGAARMIEDGVFQKTVETRYAGWKEGLGARILKGEAGFAELEAYTLENGEPQTVSGRQEMLENILNEYI